MTYTATLRALKSRLNRAIKGGLPTWLESHVADRMAYADRWWQSSRRADAAKVDRDHDYTKAVRVLDSLGEVVAAFRRSDDFRPQELRKPRG